MDIVPRQSIPVAERCYRLLLRCYPRRFREAAEPELLECFRAGRSAARSAGIQGWVRLWASILLDLRTMPLEWLSALRAPFPPRRRGEKPVDNFLQDIRYALRSFRVAPTVTVIAALTIAIGIGATTTIMGVANAFLLRAPAGIVDPGRLVTVHALSNNGSNFHAFSYLDYKDLAATPSGLSGMAAYSIAPVSLSTGGEPELKLAMVVSGNYFQVLGVQPALGRMLLPSDDQGAGGARVLVLSHAEWMRRFAGDAGVVGKTMLLNGNPFTILGVAPRGFRGHIAAADASMWVPVTLDPVLTTRRNVMETRTSIWLEIVGRLGPGGNRSAAAGALSTVSARLGREQGLDFDRRVDVRSYAPLPAPAILPAAGFLGLLLLLAFLVLLIASANVANVLLARAAARAREIAVRLALGAGRARLIRQLVTESVALFVFGGIGGTLLAVWATGALAGFHPPVGMPIAFDFSLDARVLLVAAGVTLLTGVVFGMVPALQATRPDLVRSLKDEPSLARMGKLRLRGAFVVAQVAGTALLLVTAGLFVRALGRAGTIDVGFQPRPLYTVSLMMQVRNLEPAAVHDFAAQLEARAVTIPGVASVASTDFLPLNNGNQQTVVAIAGREDRPNVGWFQTDFAAVTPDYFGTMQIPLLKGRAFSAADREGAPAVAIINETLAAKIWPGEDPIGKTLLFGSLRDGTPTLVVGLARNANYRSIGEDPLPMTYSPYAQQSSRDVHLLVRMTPGAPDPALALRAAVRGLDPALPIAQLAPMEQVVGVAMLPNRIAMGLALLFGATGLLLAAVGLYGILAYMVSRRRREIGIRMALGAASADVRRLVVGNGLRLVLIGLTLGFAGAAGVSRLLRSFLFGVSPLDPLTYGGIALLFAGVAALACLVPVRRALQTEPLEVLRHE
ncbi:MAG TPA: ABC transporter permease [Gemmatimonadales bacterium]|nr:ABC transporter permease [Gemmatimonadales bacterium]